MNWYLFSILLLCVQSLDYPDGNYTFAACTTDPDFVDILVFYCDDGSAIPCDHVCDFSGDCENDEDEANCPDSGNCPNDEWGFQCYITDDAGTVRYGDCISPLLLCNDEDDCAGGADESEEVCNPTSAPTTAPTVVPTQTPSNTPTQAPSTSPTVAPISSDAYTASSSSGGFNLTINGTKVSGWYIVIPLIILLLILIGLLSLILCFCHRNYNPCPWGPYMDDEEPNKQHVEKQADLQEVLTTPHDVNEQTPMYSHNPPPQHRHKHHRTQSTTETGYSEEEKRSKLDGRGGGGGVGHRGSITEEDEETEMEDDDSSNEEDEETVTVTESDRLRGQSMSTSSSGLPLNMQVFQQMQQQYNTGPTTAGEMYAAPVGQYMMPGMSVPILISPNQQHPQMYAMNTPGGGMIPPHMRQQMPDDDDDDDDEEDDEDDSDEEDDDSDNSDDDDDDDDEDEDDEEDDLSGSSGSGMNDRHQQRPPHNVIIPSTPPPQMAERVRQSLSGNTNSSKRHSGGSGRNAKRPSLPPQRSVLGVQQPLHDDPHAPHGHGHGAGGGGYANDEQDLERAWKETDF